MAAKSHLSETQIGRHLKRLRGWKRQGSEIVKRYPFEDYHHTMAFVNAVAWIAHQSNHHPDLEVGYNKVVVHYTTHDADALTKADFEGAHSIEGIMRN